MSLLDDFSSPCVMMNKTFVSDGYGGVKTTYTQGAEFTCAIVFDNSIESRIGQKQGVTSTYTISTNKSVNLQYHDVIKRKNDNKIFRITSDGDDKYTPSSSMLNIRQVSAEEWVLPSE